jgi:hypothetical protein
MIRLRSVPLLLAAALSAPVYAQSDVVINKRATELRDAPYANAQSIAALPAETPLTRLPVRQGAWIQVRTAAGATGWVHMFDLSSGASTASAPTNAATGALRGLTNFFNRGNTGSRTTTATSTVGIRGLGAEDIAQAQPNPGALSQMDTFRQDATQARRFAAEASLRTRTVEPLPVPNAPQAIPANSSTDTRQIP